MTEKISESEIREHWIQRLPDLPNRPGRYGDAGLSAREMKAAHDALGLCIIRHLNSLLDDITSGELLRTLGVGGMSLETLLLGLSDGRTAEAIRLDGKSLRERLDLLRQEVCALRLRLDALEGAPATEQT